ncbi:MAG: hypothetical protein AAGD92_13890 [Pseudomonadota bacterium]
MLRKSALVVLSGALFSACAENAPPVYANDQCRRLNLIDEQTGQTIIGAEDIAFDPLNQRIIISAYDRRAAEKAARKSADAPVEGGVYEVSLDPLFSGVEALEVTSIVDRGAFENGLRPHGVSVDRKSGAFGFINRAYKQEGRKWRRESELASVSISGNLTIAPAHCAANDVVLNGAFTWTTYNHASCEAGAAFEDIFNQRRSGFFLNGEPIAGDIGFANGVALDGDALVVAATREKALHLFEADAETATRVRTIQLGGAPDNISLDGKGNVIAAVHPSLMRLALNRKLGIGRAPSKILSINLDTNEKTTLFHDKKGAAFSAATVGIETRRGLVLGSVTDNGLLVCEKAP